MRSGRTDRSISPDEIRFFDNYRPLLGAGDYTLQIEQQIDSTDAAHPLSRNVNTTQAFTVAAPRFALGDAEVQARFPPMGANGVFAQNLPHIVLMERALPWERTLATDGSPVPWLALLVLTEDEIDPPPGQSDNSALANATRFGTYPVAELLKPKDAATLGPDVKTGSTDEASCRAIDITTDVFTRVTPRMAELPYLAHARQVNVANKMTALASTDGWFSVVIGNRFPAASAEGLRNIVHLVSLEGFGRYLVDRPSWPSGIRKVRLATLASWFFTARERGGNFRSLMLNLIAKQPQGGNGLRLQLPVATAALGDSPGDLARKALGQGYAALQYETRSGDQGFGWYHGPLVPHPVAPLAAGVHPFASSAAATVYDKDTGTFDLSYAAAWEIGRLLALSDRAYAENQQRARKKVRGMANLIRERTRWEAGHRLLAASNSDDLEELLDPQHVSRSVAEWLGDAAADHLPRAGVAAMAPPEDAAPMLRANAGQTAVRQVQGLLGRADVQALLARRIAAAASSGPLRSVVSWLGSLRLLHGVPFAYLVPHANMLPAESVRFFYVDPNFLDAMCDGAQSVGVQSSRDVMEQRIVRGAIREEAIRHATQLRAMKTNAVMNENAQPGDPVAGVLLRSSVISGWPGLEIKAFATADRSSPIDPVRIDPVGDDVLLALYPRVPAWIEIDEPKEGLAFGVATGMLVDLRRISGDVGKKFGNETLAPKYLRDSSRVVRVDDWQQFLKTKFSPPAGWGPAAFALQMVRAPQQMIFQNGGRA